MNDGREDHIFIKRREGSVYEYHGKSGAASAVGHGDEPLEKEDKAGDLSDTASMESSLDFEGDDIKDSQRRSLDMAMSLEVHCKLLG